MANYSLSVSGAIGTGWEYAKKHGLVIAVIILIISLLVNGIQSLFGPSMDAAEIQRMSERMAQGDMEALQQFSNLYTSGASTFGILLGAVIDILLYVGLYNLALGLVGGTMDSVSFNAFKLPVGVYVKYFVVQILVDIIDSIALFCCVVPFFFVAPRLVFAPLYVINNPEAGVFEAIKASWGMTKGNLLALIGLGFAFIGIILVGFLCCCVGAYFAAVVILFAEVAAYYQLRDNWA